MSNNIVERLRHAGNHITPELDRQFIGNPLVVGVIGLIDKSITPRHELADLLKSPEMRGLIYEGKITIGMIKPRLDQFADRERMNVNFGGDAELANELQGMIRSPLEPIVSIAMQMDRRMVDTFYAGEPRSRMESSRLANGKTRWEVFKQLMLSGPVTFMLLYEPSGNAVREWRKQMGTSWDVEKVKSEQPYALRAYAKSNDNNLLHGSDSVDSVLRELNFVAQYLYRA